MLKRILLIILILLTLVTNCLAKSGYKIYISQTQGDYTDARVIDCGLVQVRVVKNFTPGTYYSVATAYKGDLESGYSNEVTFTIIDQTQVTFAWDPSPQVPLPMSHFWW